MTMLKYAVAAVWCSGYIPLQITKAGGNIKIDIFFSGCSNSNPQTRNSFAARHAAVPGKNTVI